MKKIIDFLKQPISWWVLLPVLLLGVTVAPPIWYGGLNLNQGSTIQDPSVTSASCVITDASGVYKYQACPPTPYPTPATPAPIAVPTAATWGNTTTGTANTQLASITTTSGTSTGLIGAWVLRAYASTQSLNNAAAGDQQFMCLYVNAAPTNAADYISGTCGAVSTFTLHAVQANFSAASTAIQTPTTLVWQGQYANATTVTLRIYSTNSASASGSIGAGALMLEWIPI